MSGQCASAQRCISSYRLDACNRSRFCSFFFGSNILWDGRLAQKRHLWLGHAVRDLHLSVRLRALLPLQDLDEALRHQPAAYQP